MEEWCRENENECETEKVHCEEKYRRNEKYESQVWVQVQVLDLVLEYKFEYQPITIQLSNGIHR